MPEAAAIETFLHTHGHLLWWGGFIFGILFYALFSAIFVYHWRNYAIGKTAIRRTFWWYFTSTVTLVFLLCISLLWVTL